MSPSNNLSYSVEKVSHFKPSGERLNFKKQNFKIPKLSLSYSWFKTRDQYLHFSLF